MENPQICSVGDSLSRAMARADELRRSSPRRVRVKIVTQHGDLDPGVIIVASISAKTGPELEAQVGKGVRHVPLAELDARAHELPGLVDAAAAEIEAAVAAAPAAPKRPSHGDDGFDHETFEQVIEESYRAMLQWSSDVAANSAASLSRGGVAEALAVAGLKVAVLSAVGGRIELNDLIDMLKHEFSGARAGSEAITGSREQIH
jgi:hypothetical protein